jgi:2-dehydropantoate 2-reductase
VAVQRICVMGAGAIGSLFAAHLAQVTETWVLARRDEHATAIEEQGLRVSGKADFTARLRATADPGAMPDPDLILVAVKATQLEQTASTLAGRFPRAAVMTTQNGLGAEEIMAAAGPWPLISAVTFMSGIRHDDRHVEYELDTPTWMGPYAGTGTPFALVQEVHDLLVASGLRAEAMPDLLPAQWSKLLFNAAVNGVAALTNLPHIEAFARRDEPGDLGHVLHALIDEGKAVARARGVSLHDDPWEMNVRAVSRGESTSAGGEYAHLPSMLEDVRAQRPTEVDFISGAIVREAERAGVPAPLNAQVWRLVRGLERSWQWAREHETEVVGA